MMSEIKLLRKLTDNHFIVSFYVDKNFEKEGASDLYAMAGDSNCPHKKDYDPKDGHGYTYLEVPETHWESPFKEQLEWIVQQATERGMIKND